MESLTLASFFQNSEDTEINQYRILGGIKEYRNELNRKKIYPSLLQLIELVTSLEDIVYSKNEIFDAFPKEIVRYDLENKKIILEPVDKSPQKVELVFNLIEWSLPILKQTIEEAIVLYEFVEKNLEIDNVGILPLYKNEGYFIVPDNQLSMLQVFRFECALFSADSEKYRSLRTKLIEESENNYLRKSPELIKLELINKFKELPNPATFLCETDLDFPFNETIFPIAKRILMHKVTAS